jgi:hypothetical protein
MKALILFVSIIFLDLSNPIDSEFQDLSINYIEIKNNQLYINSESVHSNPALSEITQIIGNPSRSKIQSESEIREKKEKFGSVPSNIYTYDKDGILLYQKPDGSIINSITIDFDIQTYDFSPHETYNSKLIFNAIEINRNTSLEKLKKIPGIIIDDDIYFTNSAKLGIYDLTFEFSEAINKNQLVSMSISLSPKLNEARNNKGWSSEEIQIMKAAVKNIEQLRELAKQYDFSMDKFADCYASKISTQINYKEIQNPNERVNAIIGQAIEECVIQLIGN